MDESDASALRLEWEKAGAQRPIRVTAEQLCRGYRLCIPSGFFARSVVGRTALRELAAEQSLLVTRLLLEELGEPATREELQSWIVGRGLVSAQRFQQWWIDLEPSLLRDNTVIDLGERFVYRVDERLARVPRMTIDELRSLFLGQTPRGRYTILASTGDDVAAALLEAAVQVADAEAICLLLRQRPSILPKYLPALFDLAAAGEARLGALLLDRRDPTTDASILRLASIRENRSLIRRFFAALSPTSRWRSALRLLDQSISGATELPISTFLADQIPGGPSAALASLEESDSPSTARLRVWLAGRLAEATIDRPVARPEPLLTQLRPLPAARAFPLAAALARELSHRHARGEAGGVTGARLQANGRIELGPLEDSNPEDDVYQAVRAITELAIGNLPRSESVRGEDLIVHLAQLVADMPLEWSAVASRSLCASPALRPRNALDLWEQLEQASAVARVRDEAPRWPSLNLEVAHDTHIGHVKSRLSQVNQDAVFWQTDGPMAMLVVADGISVSTAGSGNLASALFVQTLAMEWEKHQDALRTGEEEEIHRFLDEALLLANQAVCEGSLRAAGGDLGRHIPMGTTAVVVVVRGDRAHIASLGDSRAYLVGSLGACLLTGDQNLRGEWLQSWQEDNPTDMLGDGYALVGYCGHFNEEGSPEPTPAAHRTVTILPGEVLILCSDGLTDYAAGSHAELGALLEEAARMSEPSQAARWLTDRANAGGGGDNISVVVARLA